MSMLVHEQYKSNTEVQEVLYLKDDNGKIISSMLTITMPKNKARLAHYEANRIWKEVMSELNTYGIKVATELLEYYANKYSAEDNYGKNQ